MKVTSAHASPESISALLDQVYAEERHNAHAQAEAAHTVEQGHLNERVGQLRNQADDTRNAAILSAVMGGLSAGASFTGAMFARGDSAERTMAKWDALAKAIDSAGSFTNAVGFTSEAQQEGINAENEQRLASDAEFSSRAALDRAGELRQAQDRALNTADRNEETRHTANMLFRA